MAECGDGDSSNGRPVQGPMTHCGPGSSVRRRYRGPWQIRAWQQQWGRPVICQHPMTKWNPAAV
ncbi:unnamed protein product [Staurois parvus]|uniref:Uncharacterized protein n=1 Tax=Staurois parvus TaxID=386267 RepID=A0ABN9CPA3_9NEOB|nr:unnamed protein product [Staurois parvus]